MSNKYEYKKMWALKNKAKMAAFRKKYREKNREKVREYNSAYKKKTKDRINSLRRKKRKINRESYLAQRRAYYAKNRAIMALKAKAIRERNLEKHREMARKSYYKFRGKRSLQRKRWAARSAEKIRETARKYRESNRELMRQRRRELYARNKHYPLRGRLSSRIYKLLKLTGAEKRGRTMELIGTSCEKLCAHLESLFKPGMNWNNRGKWHIDHIRPCVSFDLSDPDQQRQCFHYTNLQPLWGYENMSKGSKINWKPMSAA